MPKQVDQLPPDATALARRVAALERQIKELRAARRMSSATVGSLKIYSDDGQTLIAELGLMDDGGGGVWTRGTQDDGTPVTASLASGQLRFRPADDSAAAEFGGAYYSAIPGLASDLTLTSGAIEASDWQVLMDLSSVSGGDLPTVLLSGFRTVAGVGESGACNMDIAGILTFANIAYGSTTITPSAANTPTSAAVTGLGLSGTTFYAQVTASTSVPGSQVTGVSATSVSSNGMTLWVTRTNTTATVVHWLVIGS
ncbi:hypothetical protein ACFZDK_24615 [Streptomyces sp. NPDC007901]|uniref:hypothetical protein n=1 Tax=Streptomyces sp. NPDC007901 TaxID=3364785 RepID=UPI0036EF409B